MSARVSWGQCEHDVWLGGKCVSINTSREQTSAVHSGAPPWQWLMTAAPLWKAGGPAGRLWFPPVDSLTLNDSADDEHANALLVNQGEIMHMMEVAYDFILEVLHWFLDSFLPTTQDGWDPIRFEPNYTSLITTLWTAGQSEQTEQSDFKFSLEHLMYQPIVFLWAVIKPGSSRRSRTTTEGFSTKLLTPL